MGRAGAAHSAGPAGAGIVLDRGGLGAENRPAACGNEDRLRENSHMKRAMLVSALALMLAGCSWSRERANKYTFARIHDMIDVAHVDLTVNSAGLLANVGPVMVGYKAPMTRIPHGQRAILIGRLGLSVIDGMAEQGAAYGVVVPLSRLRVRRTFASGGGGKGYGARSPGWGSIGVDLGLFIGVGAHADVVELADFVSGFFGADICKDD
jgi:hypothetical protein